MYTLYAFATSDRPEPYVNALCYCVLHKRVKSYKVVVVREPEAGTNQIRPATIYANIVRLLTALSRATYSPNENFQPRPIGKPSDSAFDVYRAALDVLNSSGNSGPLEIPKTDLDQRLTSIIKDRHSILDVTALKNNLLIDVVANSLSFHFSELYTFDSFRKLSFDEKDLYHNLRDRDFTFRNLTDGSTVKASLTRIKRWSAGSRFLVVVTLFLLVVGLAISTLTPDSRYYAGFTLASIIASIGSFLFLFWENGR